MPDCPKPQKTPPMLLDKRPSGVVLSASQLNTWDLCKRRWAFEYIWKIRHPPHASAQLGSDVHKHLENWLRDAIPPDDSKAGKIAKRMLKHLPPPGQGAVERQFWLRTARDHNYTGYIDWSGLWDDGMPTVVDHKTTGDMRWAKTEADLHNDVQALVYAVAGFVGFGSESIRLFWNYGETKGRYNTKPVKTVVHLPQVEDKFDNVIEAVAEEVVYHHNAQTDPMSFPPTVSACSAYGGCPHQSRCNLSDTEILRGNMSGQEPTMAQRMAAMAGGGVPTQNPAAPPSAPQQQVAPPQQQVAPPQQQVAPPQQYAPPVGPNPPESGQAPPPAAAGEEPEQKKGRGRPAGAKNKTLSVEQQVFMGGVYAGISNPGWDGSSAAAAWAGQAALDAFKERFPK